MSALQSHFESLWSGTTSTRSSEHHPFTSLDIIEEVGDGIAFYKNFVNMAVLRCDEGCVLLDTGTFVPFMQDMFFKAARSYTAERIHTAVYTHGHTDHAYGLPVFLRECEDRGWEPPAIVGHAAVPARMQRYIDTAGYNGVINERQFGVPMQWPTDPIYPTRTFSDEMTLEVGGRKLELFHARGETDDHTWIHIPDARAIYTGDLFIWAMPNAGNPQKVQRYALEWARALRRMQELEAEVLLPGHGVPVFGAANVRVALGETARTLEYIHDETLARMNEGATVYDIIGALDLPADLAGQPFLQPVYDEPEFIARNVYRCLGGWYSGVPSELKPASPAAQGREIAALAGGVDRLLDRARALLDEGDHRLACHLVDWAAHAEPDSKQVHSLRARVYAARVETESSTMARGIFGAARRESEGAAKP